MKKRLRWGIRVLAALLLSVFSCCAVQAALTSGSLRVTLTDRRNRPAENVAVILFPVGKTDGTLTEEFLGAEIEPDSLLSDRDNAANARTLADWAGQASLSGTESVTDANGTTTFSDLPLGIYLVMCREGQRASFSPFLVSVPTTAGGTTRYHVASHPKTEDPPDRRDDPSDPDTPPVPGEDPGGDTPGTEPDGDEPSPVPSLPQTGIDPLPMYLLLAGGGILLAVGFADLMRERRNRDE